MKAWRLSVLLAVAFVAALAVPGITHAWSPDWGNSIVSYIHFWGGGPYAINWYGNPGDNNNGVETYAMSWQAQQRTDLPNPGGKILRYPCQQSAWPYNIYVSGTTMVFRQGTGCEWYDPSSGQWSGRLGNDRFPYLFTNAPVANDNAYAVEFIWRYMDYQPHGAGFTLNNGAGQTLFQLWADAGLTGHESFRVQGHEVFALPNLGHEYFVRFETYGWMYVLSVQDRWTGQWYSWQEGAYLSSDGANLGIGNAAIMSGVDTWVSFYVGGITFYTISPSLRITSVSPASPQPIGTQVNVTARMIHSETIYFIEFYANTANDGSASGTWVRFGTQYAPTGWQDFTATARWDTAGWSPGVHLVVVNGYTVDWALLPWYADPARQYLFRIGPSPSLCITGVSPGSPQPVGTYVNITARLQHYEELDHIDFYENDATDGSANGSWTYLGTQYAPGGAWDLTATVSANSYYWYWGTHLLVVNGFTRSGSYLPWYGDGCRQQTYRVGPSPYLAITGYAGSNPSPVGASITFSARLKYYDYLDRIDFYVNQASDGSSSGAWTYLGAARPSGNVFDFTGSAAWNTSGLSPGSYLVVVNGWTKSGVQIPWTGSSDRQLVFRLGPVPYLCMAGVWPGSPQPVGTGVSVSARMQHYAGVSYIAFWVNQATDGSANGSWTYLGYQSAPSGSMDFTGGVTWDTSGYGYGDHLIVVNGWANDGSWLGYGPCSSNVYRVGPQASLSIQGVSPPSPEPIGITVNITARMTHWEYVSEIDFYANDATDGSSNGTWRLLGSASPSGNQFDYTASMAWNTSGWAQGTHLIGVNGYSKAGRAYYWSDDGSRRQTYILGPGASLSITGISPSSPQPVGVLVSITARMTHWEYVARIEFYANDATDGSANGAWRPLPTLYPSGSQFDFTTTAVWNTAGWTTGTHLLGVNGYSAAGKVLYWYQDGTRQARYTIGPAPSLCLQGVSPSSPQPIGTQVRFSGHMTHYAGVDSVTGYVNTATDGSASGSWVNIGQVSGAGSMDFTASFTWNSTGWTAGNHMLAVEGRALNAANYAWSGDPCRQARFTIGPSPALALTGASPASPEPVGTLVTLSAHMSHYQGVDHIEFSANVATDGSSSGAWQTIGTVYGSGAMDYTGTAVWNTAGWATGTHLLGVNGYSAAGTALYWYQDGTRQARYTIGPAPSLCLQGVSPTSPQPIGTQVRFSGHMTHYAGVDSVTGYVNTATDGSASGSWVNIGQVSGAGNMDFTASFTWNSAGWATGTHLLAVEGRALNGATYAWSGDPCRQARFTVGPSPALTLTGASPASPEPVGAVVTLSAHMTHYQGVDRIEFSANTAADGSSSGAWQSIGTAYGSGAMDYTGSVTWNTDGWALGTHLLVANGYSKGGDSLLWTGNSARELLYTIGNPPSLTITNVQPPSPHVVGTTVSITALMQHYQYIDRVEFLVNQAQDGSASGPWQSLGVSRAQGNVFSFSATATWDTTGWTPGGTYLIVVNGYTKDGTLLSWIDDPRRQARYRLLVDTQPPAVLPMARDPASGAVAGSDIAWVIGRPLNLVLSGRITPPPYAQSVTVLGYTYREHDYGPNDPVSLINHVQGWSRPMKDAIDYSLRVSTTYVDGQVLETDFNLRINVTVAYTRVSH